MRRGIGVLFVLGLLLPVSTVGAAQVDVAVVGIGGIDSSLGAPAWAWLAGDLGMPEYEFGYGPNGANTLPDTCNPIDTSRGRLSAYVRTLRANGVQHVIVAGHSLGGVVAFDMAAEATDLTQGPDPFIRAVVTIDSPLSGLSGAERFLGEASWGYCRAARDLRDRSVRGALWQPWLVASAQNLGARGVRVILVSNPSDMTIGNQGLNGAPINYTLDDADGGTSHSAITNDPAAMATIAGWIQGQ